MPNLNRIGPIEPELWQKWSERWNKERKKKEFLHSFLAKLKKSQLLNRKKKNVTCGFHLRIEEGKIYSEKKEIASLNDQEICRFWLWKWRLLLSKVWFVVWTRYVDAERLLHTILCSGRVLTQFLWLSV